MSDDSKVAIVTGGGRGIGAAIARELHDEGYKLALMSPTGSARELATKLGGVGVNGGCEDPAALEELVGVRLYRNRRIQRSARYAG